MKSTGIVRKVDSLGRIVLPIELRRLLDIDIKDPIEIYTEDDFVVLTKYAPRCIFCESNEDIVEFKGNYVCKSCIKSIEKEIE